MADGLQKKSKGREMSNTIVIAKKSIIMLFSFAVVASMLTVMAISADKTGGTNLLTNMTQAQASGSIGIESGEGVPATGWEAGRCTGGCNPKPVSDVGQVDPRFRTTVYSCTALTKSPATTWCENLNIKTRDTHTWKEICPMRFTVNGALWAGENPAVAMNVIRFNFATLEWNPRGASEQMISHLAGRNPYSITDWSQTWSWGGWNMAPFQTGPFSWSCTKQVVTDSVIVSHGNFHCPTKQDGRPFPHAVGVSVTLWDHNNKEVGTWGALNPQKNKDFQFHRFSCLYVSTGTPPPKVARGIDTCYYNLTYKGAYSTNRAAIANGGTPTSTVRVKVPFSGIKPSVQGSSGNSNLRLVNCTTSYRMSAELPLTQYAYYRLEGHLMRDRYQTYIWDTRYTVGQELIAEIRRIESAPIVRKVYGTNVCRPGAANSYSEYATHAALPNVNFSYSECQRNTGWKCTTSNPRINGVSNAIEVMRNGNKIPTVLGGATITGNAVRDAGGTPGVVSDDNMSYRVSPLKDSSPFNGTNPNADKQHFEMWKADGKTETKWDTWLKNPRANQNSFMSYYWSSDNGKKWAMQYEAKLDNVDFAVPWQDWSESPATIKWMNQKNVDCDGVKNSNSVTVLRSVSSDT